MTKQEKLRKVFGLWMDLNGTEYKGSGPHVNVEFSATTPILSVRIYPNGYQNGYGELEDFMIFLEDEIYRESEMNRVIARLEELKKCAGSGNSEVAHTKDHLENSTD